MRSQNEEWRELATFMVLGQPIVQPRGRNVAVKRCVLGHVTRFNYKTLANDPDPLRCGMRLPGGKCAHQALPTSRSYPDDKRVKPWKHAVLVAAHRSRLRPEQPLDEPVKVDIDLYFRRPSDRKRTKDPDDRIWHTKRPDRDNLEKPILDALQNAGWWVDDARVCSGELQKFYAGKDDEPRAVVRVSILTTPGDEDRQADLELGATPAQLGEGR